jgi:CBS domain containing-hemolysin-like protein
MTMLFFYLFIAVFISFLCSIMESVLLTAPSAYLKAQANSGKRGARRLFAIKSSIARPLAAILSLNTVAHTIGAAGVGAEATSIFGEAYFGIISAVLTLIILIFSEIIPKTIGARYWQQLIGTSAVIIRAMMIISYPLVWLSDLLGRMLGGHQEPSVSREEIGALAEMAGRDGAFAQSESRIIQNIVRLRQVKLTEIMTPRVVVSLAPESMSVGDFMVNAEFQQFSRIPIYTDKPDQVSGYVLRAEVSERAAADEHELRLDSLRHPITVVPGSLSITDLWEKLMRNNEHIAVIIDEYGGLEGLVTLEDIIETMLGLEIVDERDGVTDMRALARSRWQARKRKADKSGTESGPTA